MNVKNVFSRRSALSLLIAILGLIGSSSHSYAANVIQPNNPDAVFQMPALFSTYFKQFEVAVGADSSALTGQYVVTAYDGPDAGIIVTDGTDTADWRFDQVPYTPYFGQNPTVFNKPDVALVSDGNNMSAIVTFETDTGAAYVVQFSIAYTPLLSINPSGMLQDPINPSADSSEPRIDSDPVNNRFAIVTMQNGDLYYSIYDYQPPTYTTFAAPSSIANAIATQNAPGFLVSRLHPDIALTFETGTFNPTVVVSYREYDSIGNPTLMGVNVDETYNNGGPQLIYTNVFPYPVGVLANVDDLGYPKIAADNGINGSPATGVHWAMTFGDLITNGGFPVPHLWYVNSVGSQFEMDAPFSFTPAYRNLQPTLDWQPDIGLDDALVAWHAADSNGAGFMQTYAIMAPGNIGIADWYRYNSSSNPEALFQATSVYSDALLGRYIVAYSDSYQKISYKLRAIGDLNY